ncbi:hypothetical protein ACFE04_006205 [Oxalis oulophora]
MNISTSECSSGCESGWTHYLDHSSNYSKSQWQSFDGNDKKEEEDDLSMVSDASSGPRHYCEEDDHEDYSCVPTSSSYYNMNIPEQVTKKINNKKKKNVKNLEDTASSPVKCFSQKNVSVEHNVNYSQGYSATHYKEKSTFGNKRYGFLPSTFSGKPSTGKHGGY